MPPAETAGALAAGKIDGFCAGAPWGAVAARGGFGRNVTTSSAIWNHGTEKVFAVRQRAAEENPERLFAVLRAVLRAAAYCDAPANAASIAGILAQERYLGLPPEIVLSSLPGGRSENGSDASVFFASAATFPWRSHAGWFLGQMRRWSYLGREVDLEAAMTIFRPDLYAIAARAVGVPIPTTPVKSEGRHATDWQLPATPQPILMGPDAFMDGAVFDPSE